MIFQSKGTREEKHRLIILTDMENEPDDSQTMVKLLMYSNEIDIEGLIAVTSCHLRNLVFPESIANRVEAYGVVRPNLMKHASGWPTRGYLMERIAGGQRGYGMDAVGDNQSTPGSELIIRAIDRDDPRPVWIAVNAGSNTLAQALWDVRKTRSKEEVDRFVSKIRVYDDSGQDNAGAWMCSQFPELFYIRSLYQVFGLFGPEEGMGPNSTAPLDHFHWAELNVRTRHGVLGELYPQRFFIHGPRFCFMDGGGTTTWLGLANKGLFVPEQISWGGWGGRFSWKKEKVFAGQELVKGQEDQFGEFLMYPQTADYSFEWQEDDIASNTTGLARDARYDWREFAPLWRWRDDYLADFKARMDWCVCDYLHANHYPVINFYGDENRTPIYLIVEPGERVRLDASASWDPDDRVRYFPVDNFKAPQEKLDFAWYCYPEAGTYEGKVAIQDSNQSIAYVEIPRDASQKQIHIILDVRDRDSDAPLKSYRRIVMDVE